MVIDDETRMEINTTSSNKRKEKDLRHFFVSAKSLDWKRKVSLFATVILLICAFNIPQFLYKIVLKEAGTCEKSFYANH